MVVLRAVTGAEVSGERAPIACTAAACCATDGCCCCCAAAAAAAAACCCCARFTSSCCLLPFMSIEAIVSLAAGGAPAGAAERVALVGVEEADDGAALGVRDAPLAGTDNQAPKAQ